MNKRYHFPEESGATVASPLRIFFRAASFWPSLQHNFAATILRHLDPMELGLFELTAVRRGVPDTSNTVACQKRVLR